MHLLKMEVVSYCLGDHVIHTYYLPPAPNGANLNSILMNNASCAYAAQERVWKEKGRCGMSCGCTASFRLPE